MLDLKFIRENIIEVEEALKKRGMDISLVQFISLDEKRRQLIQETDALRNQRKVISDKIGKLKKENQPPEKLDKVIAESEEIRAKIKEKEKEFTEIEQQVQDFLLNIPNLPDKSIPAGKSENDNKIINEYGEQKKFDFEPLPHWEIGTALGILDFETAAKISGARFSILKDRGAALERALITFMLDTHTRKHGYTEILAPYLVNKESATGTGQLPKFSDEIFRCKDDELYLIPTAEMSVTNIHRGETIPEDKLPYKYVSYSACFRRESGSYGKDTKGLIRNHQFNKVELVKFVQPEKSMEELELLTNDAAEILSLLGFRYRVIELCTGEIGFSSSKTYDLEVWMPGEKRWREISSCSNFKDFQARRMNIKWQRKDGNKEFLHTLNGSGVAVGRTFACLLETYQNKDGSITIPEVLLPYLDFNKIEKE